MSNVSRFCYSLAVISDKDERVDISKRINVYYSLCRLYQTTIIYRGGKSRSSFISDSYIVEAFFTGVPVKNQDLQI